MQFYMDHVHLKLRYGHVMWLFYPFVSLLFILCVWVFARVYACVPDMFLVPSVTRRRWEVPWNWSHRLLSWEPSSDPQQLQHWTQDQDSSFLWATVSFLLDDKHLSFCLTNLYIFPFGHNIPVCCIWLEGCTNFGSYAQGMICGRHGW